MIEHTLSFETMKQAIEALPVFDKPELDTQPPDERAFGPDAVAQGFRDQLDSVCLKDIGIFISELPEGGASKGGVSKNVVKVQLPVPLLERVGVWQKLLRDAVTAELGAVPQDFDQTVLWEVKVDSRAQSTGQKPIAGVKHLIAVASGKGGVGKSTTAVNLALALAQSGSAVGILDADIYGPSVPTMLGLSNAGHPPMGPDKMLRPHVAHGIAAMSMGFLTENNTPMVWRGPMVSGALMQLLHQTRWPDLDYLIVDMPPGTGDIQLTLSQQVPVDGAVIVTTPQDIACLDARKGVEMFRKVRVPILGVVENMAMFHCPGCGLATSVFGQEGGQQLAAEYDIPLLGQLPLSADIRSQTDAGLPTVLAAPQSTEAQSYVQAALRMAVASRLMSLQAQNSVPKITVVDD